MAISYPPHAEIAAAWAEPVDHLQVDSLPSGAVNLNVTGKVLTGPMRGFGQLWRKTYRITLHGITPRQVVREWKENFEHFWPPGNHFHAPLQGIRPGSVAVLNLAQPSSGPPLISTGVWVIYADEESFSFMTPQGHMFAGIVTFSAIEEDIYTVAQVQAFLRASDPLYELSFRLKLGHNIEDAFWQNTLRNLATHFGQRRQPSTAAECLDPRVQWRQAGNLWHNAAIRTALYALSAPLRRITRK
jgi:hypothetical protein